MKRFNGRGLVETIAVILVNTIPVKIVTIKDHTAASTVFQGRFFWFSDTLDRVCFMTLPRYLFATMLAIVAGTIHAKPDHEINQNNATAPADHSFATDEVLLQAMSLLGVAYKFGGSSPIYGLDCSGFIQYIFRQALQLNMPRTAAKQAQMGVAVSHDDLQSGDLVFFNTRRFPNSHVGLYLGDGKFIHAPRTGKDIEVGDMNASYWKRRYNGARRIIHLAPKPSPNIDNLDDDDEGTSN